MSFVYKVRVPPAPPLDSLYDRCQNRSIARHQRCTGGNTENSKTYLGMQFGGVLSTSQVANSFIGTGFGPAEGKGLFGRSAIFRFILSHHKETLVKLTREATHDLQNDVNFTL